MPIEMPPDHVRMSAARLRIRGRPAKHLGDELRDEARMMRVHVREDRRQHRILRHALIKPRRQPLEYVLPANPFEQCWNRR
jgi:hypothetical protein